jgi:ribonuclease J
MKLMLHLVKPKYLIPVHGELRHLYQHKQIAQGIGIPAENIAVVENGQVVEFRSGSMKISERVPGGYVFVDGSGVGDVAPSTMREREALAREGFFLVSLLIDKKTGKLREEPEILTRGFVQKEFSDHLITAACRKITETVANSNGSLQEDLEQMLKTFLFNETRRRPTVLVTLNKT